MDGKRLREREREKETDIERERETDRQSDRWTDREIAGQRDSWKDRDGGKDRWTVQTIMVNSSSANKRLLTIQHHPRSSGEGPSPGDRR